MLGSFFYYPRLFTGIIIGAQRLDFFMPFQIITIPFDPSLSVFHTDLLNDFLINKQLLSYRAEFFQQQSKFYWTVLVEYEPVLPKSDKNKQKLSPEQEVLFNRLREWRKEMAEKQGVPVYVVSNNEILTEIAVNKPQTMEALKQIKGLGEKKATEFGQQLLHLVQTFIEKK